MTAVWHFVEAFLVVAGILAIPGAFILAVAVIERYRDRQFNREFAAIVEWERHCDSTPGMSWMRGDR